MLVVPENFSTAKIFDHDGWPGLKYPKFDRCSLLADGNGRIRGGRIGVAISPASGDEFCVGDRAWVPDPARAARRRYTDPRVAERVVVPEVNGNRASWGNS